MHEIQYSLKFAAICSEYLPAIQPMQYVDEFAPVSSLCDPIGHCAMCVCVSLRERGRESARKSGGGVVGAWRKEEGAEIEADPNSMSCNDGS